MLRGVADALQIGGVRRMPNYLQLDSVGLCMPIEAGGMAGRQEREGSAIQVWDGLTGPDIRCWGNGAVSVAPLVDSQAGEMRVSALSLQLTFSAAAALAFNGKLLDLTVYMARFNATAQAALVHLFPWVTVATAQLVYRFALNASTNWSGFVPSEYDLNLRVQVRDLTPFPINSQAVIDTVGVTQPADARLPM
jgi:hypothetical protein